MLKFWKYKEERDTLQKENLQLRIDNESLRNEVFEVHGQLIEAHKAKYFPNVSTDDPSPLDTQERAAYLAGVVSFFENIGLKKLGQLTAKAKEDLSNPLNNRDYDLAIKGTINAFAQLLDWKDECEGELRSTVQEKANDNQ